MGNQVLRGADFAAVAKKHSQEANATEGGYHDWTNQGSLVSEVLDQAIFSLPVNRLSLKLEDERGFHIVRVIERQEARRIEFVEAQDEIRTKLQDDERKAADSRLHREAPQSDLHWTIFDQLAQQPPKTVAQ